MSSLPSRPVSAYRQCRRAVVRVAATSVVVAGVASQRHALLAAATRVRGVTPPLLLLALLLEVLSLTAAAELQRRLLSGGGVRTRLRSLLALVWASNAVGAALPAGTVASTLYTYRHLTRRGAPSVVVGWLLGASGIASGAALALLVVVGAQLRGVLSRCRAVDALEVVASVGVVAATIGVLAWASAHPGRVAVVARRVPRLWARKKVLRSAPDDTRTNTLPPVALSGAAWTTIGALAMANWAADGAVLAVSLVAVGARPAWCGVAFAYALSQVAASVPLLPGSIGVAEGSLVAALMCAGVRAPDALAATLLYRVASFWLQLPPGAAAWAALRYAAPFDRRRVAAPAATGVAALG
jgi:uncharacterized membrane protein YbhN (UPF0104 family)